MGPRNHVLDRDQDRTNPFAAANGANLRCGLLPNYFGFLLTVVGLSHLRNSYLLCGHHSTVSENSCIFMMKESWFSGVRLAV